MRPPRLLLIGGMAATVAALLALVWVLVARPDSRSPSAARGTAVAFVGDSLTARGLWQAAYPDRVVFNQGVDGDTTLQLMLRLPAIRQTGAGTYLLMVGINDIYRGWDPEGIASRIAWLRNGLQFGSGARVIVQSTIPCARLFCGSDRLRRVEELNRLLARRIPPRDFADLTPAMADADGLKLVYTIDGVHLSGAGYVRWLERLKELGLP